MAPFRKMGPVTRERGVLRMRNYGREADRRSGSEPDKSLAPCVTWAVSEQRSARIHASRTREAGSSGGLDNAGGRLCPLSDDVVNRARPRSWLYQSGLCGYSETMKRHLNP